MALRLPRNTARARNTKRSDVEHMLNTKSEISAFSTDRHGREDPTLVQFDELYERPYVNVRNSYRRIRQKPLIVQQ